MQRVPAGAAPWLSAACCLAALGVSSPARGAELLLAQPSVCAIGDELSFRVERALGRPVAAAGPARCTLQVARENAGSFSARLEIESPGQAARLRSFHAPSCEKLADTLALAIVLALGGADAAGASATESAAEPTAPSDDLAAGLGGGAPSAELPPAPDPTTDAGAELPSDASSGESTALHTTLAAGLVLDAGTLPALGVGPALAAALGTDRVAARAVVTWLPARDASVEPPAGAAAGAEIGLVTGALLACAPLRTELSADPRLELGACAGAELGWLSGSGVGVSAPSRRGALWSAARLDLAGRYGVGPSGLRVALTLSALLPFERHEFVVVEESVHRPAPIVGRVGLGLELDLDPDRADRSP